MITPSTETGSMSAIAVRVALGCAMIAFEWRLPICPKPRMANVTGLEDDVFTGANVSGIGQGVRLD